MGLPDGSSTGGYVTSFARPVVGRLIVRTEQGEEWEPTAADLDKFGLGVKLDLYMRAQTMLIEALGAEHSGVFDKNEPPIGPCSPTCIRRPARWPDNYWPQPGRWSMSNTASIPANVHTVWFMNTPRRWVGPWRLDRTRSVWARPCIGGSYITTNHFPVDGLRWHLGPTVDSGRALTGRDPEGGSDA